MITPEQRAAALGLHGLLARRNDIAEADWLQDLIADGERERRHRSLERRRAAARLPAFVPLADFDRNRPRHIDRDAVATLMTLDFIDRADNAVLVGGHGTGKTMIAANIAHQALLRGHTVRFENAPNLLADLAAPDSRQTLLRRLAMLARPRLLLLDDIGHVSLDSRLADILHAIIGRRCQRRSTMPATSLGFGQRNRIFPGAAGIAATVDRLTHNATIVTIDGDSRRLHHSRT